MNATAISEKNLSFPLLSSIIEGVYKRSQKMENTPVTMNDHLVKVFNQIWEAEEKAVITMAFSDLTVNEMHAIEAIGPNQSKCMSDIAHALGITLGSLTTSMNVLLRKGYIERMRSTVDRRVVNICLSEKGLAAYQKHAEFHHQMTQSVLNHLSEDEVPILLKGLESISAFLETYLN